MTHRSLPVLAALMLMPVACTDEIPTAARDELVQPGLAVEVTLPFEDFLTSTVVYGGYGRASQLGGGFIAHEFGPGPDEEGVEGTGLEAVTLVRFAHFPGTITTLDSAGTNRNDTLPDYRSGTILVRFDTVGSVADGPIEIAAHSMTETWDPLSANWSFAVDTLGDVVPWSEPGGGAVEEIATSVWDPAEGDSVEIMLDSALLELWKDSTVTPRDVRLGTNHPGVRLRVTFVQVRLETVPSIHPDTVVTTPVPTTARTFLYNPLPRPPRTALRVGGAPAWRTILNLDVPRSLAGVPELCEALGCPVEITADQVSYAGLQLTTVAGSPAFAPSDTLLLDVRMVTAPDFLPKSPLGPPTLRGEILSPEIFRPPAGQVVEVPVTDLVRDQLRGKDRRGLPVTSTVALLSFFEPLSIEYATFAGRSSDSPPSLRLILNFSRGG